MNVFIIVSTLLTILALFLLIRPIFRANNKPNAYQIRQLHEKVTIKLNSLNQAIDKASIDKPNYQTERQRLANQTLDSIEAMNDKPKIKSTGSNLFALFMIALFVPAITVLMYLKLGSPGLLASKSMNSASHAGATNQNSLPPIPEMIIALEEKLKTDPNNIEGWFMLGRSYMITKNYPKAIEALRKAKELNDNDPDILMRLADALAMNNNGIISGEPTELVLKALELDPNHTEALWLAGLAAEEAGQVEDALKFWGKARKNLKNDPKSLNMIDQAIASIKQSGNNPDIAGSSTDNADSDASTITVTVSVDKTLLEESNPQATDTVFIFARAKKGPPMPLAVKRVQYKDLPTSVILDDSMAMVPNQILSDFEQVVIGARVSKSGKAVGQTGDLEGITQAVTTAGNQQVNVIIDRIRQ